MIYPWKTRYIGNIVIIIIMTSIIINPNAGSEIGS